GGVASGTCLGRKVAGRRMKVARGMKARSGWAALVVRGTGGDEPVVVTRRRLELVEEAEASWAKQPYHAAERMNPLAARRLVEKGIESARRIAVSAMPSLPESALHARHAR